MTFNQLSGRARLVIRLVIGLVLVLLARIRNALGDKGAALFREGRSDYRLPLPRLSF